jgi:hypothetical protein
MVSCHGGANTIVAEFIDIARHSTRPTVVIVKLQVGLTTVGEVAITAAKVTDDA